MSTDRTRTMTRTFGRTLGGQRREAKTREGTSFGELLRACRRAANLTQEELAARSRLSVDAIGTLERGIRRAPRAATLALLSEALRLNAAERTELSAAASRRPVQGRHTFGIRAAFPAPLTSLVGRDEIVRLVRAKLANTEVRLLTLTGAPGVGKTRVAIAAGDCLVSDYPDGAWLVSLESVKEPGLVAGAIRQALGLSEEEGRSPIEILIAHCRSRRLLLMLDNFEHLLLAASLLADMIAQCSRMQLVVTSRAPLRVRAEVEMPIPPLELPLVERGPVDPHVLGQVPSVALFVERATAFADGFQLTADNAPAVAAICRRLDGLPLALELAAAWIRLLTPEDLLRRLICSLPLLIGGPRDVPERRRTMRTTLAWSWDLLSADQQAVLRRISVFVGSAPVNGIERVCNAVEQVRAGVLPSLASLTEQNLVLSRIDPPGCPRIGMLEIVRESGLERLEAHGEAGPAWRAHAEYYADLAQCADGELRAAPDDVWLQRLDQ